MKTEDDCYLWKSWTCSTSAVPPSGVVVLRYFKGTIHQKVIVDSLAVVLLFLLLIYRPICIYSQDNHNHELLGLQVTISLIHYFPFKKLHWWRVSVTQSTNLLIFSQLIVWSLGHKNIRKQWKTLFTISHSTRWCHQMSYFVQLIVQNHQNIKFIVMSK